MECPKCGYEIEKPNPKKCPACGHKLIHKEQIDKALVAPQESQLDIDTSEVPQSIPQDYSSMPHTPEPEMIECPRCNTLISEENNFCPRCGYNMRVPDNNDQQQDTSTRPSIHESYTDSEIPSVSHEASEVYNNEIIEEEVPIVDDYSDNVRYEEDNTEFENGSYQPYPDTSVDDNEVTILHEEGTAFTSWLTIVGTAVLSVAMGCLLYMLFE